MTRGKPHPPEPKAKAKALLLAGHRQSEVCELTGLDHTTVWRLATSLNGELRKVVQKKSESDFDLIMGYFRAALNAMRSQAELFGDHEYCRTQNAHDLAIAHGVLGDKLAGVAATAQALGFVGPTSGSFSDRELPEPADTDDD